MKRMASTVGLTLAVSAALPQVRMVPLDRGWTIERADAGDALPAVVPGTVQQDLLRAGRIPDPAVDRNIEQVQWVGEQDWVYRYSLSIDDEILTHDHIDLVFKGLDTFAEVVLNGEMLGRADNMFRTWEFPIRDRLRAGRNRLEVRFRSPVVVGRERRSSFGIQLPSDNEVGPLRIAPYVRKAAYQFGWDFCPPLVTIGIWQPVELRVWDVTRITGVQVDQRDDGRTVAVHCRVTTAGDVKGCKLAAILDGEVQRVDLGPDGVGEAVLMVADPQRWWPNGSGERPLYRLQVELWRNGRVLDRRCHRIGLRRIALDQAKDDQGQRFTFVVNGEPLFMKGANMVPPDMLLPRAGDSTWVRLVRDMQRAHFNMVRVWGGGVYPPDAFFDACDTAGILVWQDLMFANMTPDDPPFIASVEGEVRDQVGRIGHHACLALWCGNNELDVAWKNWGWRTKYGYDARDSTRLRRAYHDLFERTLPRWIAELDHTPYIPSSPISNWGNSVGLGTGDLHYWGVWHADSSFASFKGNTGRFVSEYGFQSYPDSATLALFLSPDERVLGSEVLRSRQRSYRTDRPILEAIRREEGAVPATLGAFINAGQRVQALALHKAIMAHWNAASRCMGSLFWQLNDCWPGPSWSVIDVTGRWKAAMYVVEEDFGRMDARVHPMN